MNDLTYEIVASTRLIEKSPNFFTAILSGKFFTAEYFPMRKRIALSMGISHASADQKDKLLRRLTEVFSLHQDDILFDNHSVCLVIPAEEEWLPRIDLMIGSMETWAIENSVSGGCFLCGCSDPSVNVSEVGEIRSFLCEPCRTNVKKEIFEAVQQNQKKIQEAEIVGEYIKVNHLRGMIAATMAGVILSWIWSGVVINLPLPFIFSFILSALLVSGMYEIYKHVAESFSIRGFILTSIGGFVTVLVSLVYSLSIILSNTETAARLASGMTPSVVSASSVALNLGTYLTNPAYSNVSIATCVMTVIGFAFAVILRIIIEKTDH